MRDSQIRYFRVIGILLFIWIIFRVQWVGVWSILCNLKVNYILSYSLIFLIATLLKILRLYLILNKLGFGLKFSLVYVIVVESSLYGVVTPARAGELSRVVYLKSHGISNRIAWFLVLIERLIDASVLSIACIIGVLYFASLSMETYGILLALLLIISLSLFYCLKNLFIFPKITYFFFNLLLKKSKVNPVNESPTEFKDLLQLGKLSTYITIPCSFAILFLSFFQLTLLGLSLNSNISSLYLGFAYTLSSLFSYLPISIGGLGTREIVYISALSKVGIPENIAFIISLLDGLIFPIIFLTILITPILFYRSKLKQ